VNKIVNIKLTYSNISVVLCFEMQSFIIKESAKLNRSEEGV
jgi:hypothetical protein